MQKMKDLDFLVTKNHQNSLSSNLCFNISVLFIVFLYSLSYISCGCREQVHGECEAICIQNSNRTAWKCELRALILLPNSIVFDASLPKVRPVFELAELAIRKQQILPAFIDIKWIPYDDSCDASIASISSMDGTSKDCVHVIFGPACDYALAPVARIAKYFHAEGTPVITAAGFAGDFLAKRRNCSDEYFMLIRTGLLNYKSIAYTMTAIMKKYDWSNVVFIYERNGHNNLGFHTCHLCMSTLAGFYRQSNITYSSFVTDSAVTNMTENLRREVGVDHSITKL